MNNELNADQQAAVEAEDRNIVVLAGPGAGKTKTLVARIRHLVDVRGIHPDRIAALTFTNAAAREIEHRLAPPGTHEADEVYKTEIAWIQTPKLGHAGTLHSFCLRMLREHGTGMGYGSRMALVSPESTRDLLESKARSLGCKTSIDKLLELKGQIGLQLPNARRTPDELAIAAYLEEMRFSGIVDFDAILSEFRTLLFTSTEACDAIAAQFEHCLVDEAQDGAPIDWAIYRALPIKNKLWVGDDSQAIYGFRGSAVGEFLAQAQSTGTRLIKLEQNYRSRAEICEAANRLIRHNSQRIDKQTTSVKGSGGAVEVRRQAANEGEELANLGNGIKLSLEAGMQPQEIAIICRTNAMVANTSKTLSAWGLPVAQPAQTRLPKDWPALRAFIEHLVQPENDTLAFLWLVAEGENQGKTPRAARMTAHASAQTAAFEGKSISALLGYGQLRQELAHIHKRLNWCTAETQMLVAEKVRQLPPGSQLIDLALALTERDEPPAEKGPQITVCTVHKSKGLEWDVVFVLGLEDEGWPGRRKGTDIEEERRALFVAVTRARERLYLSHASSRVAKFGNFEKIESRTPSRFLKEMLP